MSVKRKYGKAVLVYACFLSLFLLFCSCAGRIHKAVIQGDFDKVKSFLGKGDQAENSDWYGNTPLSLAVEYNRPEVVRLLIESGADVNMPNGNTFTNDTSKFPTCTPLMVAAYFGRDSLARGLIQQGARVNVRDKFGNPAWMWSLYGDVCFHRFPFGSSLPLYITDSTELPDVPFLISPRPGVIFLEDNNPMGNGLRSQAGFTNYLVPGEQRFLVQYFYSDSAWVGDIRPEEKILGVPTIIELNVKPDGVYLLNYSIAPGGGWKAWIDEIQLPQELRR